MRIKGYGRSAARPATASVALPTADSGVDPAATPPNGTWHDRDTNDGNPTIGFHLDGKLSTSQPGVLVTSTIEVYDGVKLETNTISDVEDPNKPNFKVEAQYNMSGYVQASQHSVVQGTTYKVRSECRFEVHYRVPGQQVWTEVVVSNHEEEVEDWMGKKEYTHKGKYSGYLDGDALDIKVHIVGQVDLETSRGDMWIRGEAKSAGDVDDPSLQGSVTAYEQDDNQQYTAIVNGTPSQSFGP